MHTRWWIINTRSDGGGVRLFSPAHRLLEISFLPRLPLCFPALHLSWQHRGGTQDAASKSAVEVLPPVQRWSQLLKHTFKTLRSPEIMNTWKCASQQEEGKGQRRQVLANLPSPGLILKCFLLTVFATAWIPGL